MRLLWSLSALAFTGYNFCNHCGRIVNMAEDTPNEKQKCPRCKKREVVYHPPCLSKPITSHLSPNEGK